jgi:hypothetical protein
MVDELKFLLNDLSKLGADQKGVYTTWVIVQLIRDLAYYTFVTIVVISLGRRLIHAILAAYRESNRA